MSSTSVPKAQFPPNVDLQPGMAFQTRDRLGRPMPVWVRAVKDDQVTITNELFDLKNAGIQFATGTRIRSVVGVWTYFYGFHLAPRSAADIELM